LAAGRLAAPFTAFATVFATAPAALATVLAAAPAPFATELAAEPALTLVVFAFAFALAFAFERFALAFALPLFAAWSPQAIPSAPIPRTAESAITFFITGFSCLLQRLDLIFEGKDQQAGQTILVPHLSFIGTIGNYIHMAWACQPRMRPNFKTFLRFFSALSA
jgi:hypothetical protein